MAAPREQPPQPQSQSQSRGRAAPGTPAEPVTHSVIDYALARRATLADVYAGRLGSTEVCDAHPYLLRAARHHGQRSETRCPICRDREPLIHVTYVYGDGLGEGSGRARRAPELIGLARAHGEVRVYVVEVCLRCSWNHLVTSSVVGGVPPAPHGTRRRA